ncbi:AraC family transcriptional regulator [Rhodoferax sp. UBA5149]|uniref:AraC family transcriptional regulator n=1 Tax=Rhodoferax sp. UBA5149 TaxID=1947379 RepID=UPI0025FDD940|nr:AraC family transcriptional regulator [Rhodoferax sp. UBA5149]
MMERTSSAAWLRGVAGMFEAEGLDVPALFAATQLNMKKLDDPDARYPADDISELWDLAVARSGKTTLGLSRKLAAKYGNFDLVGYAMVSSPTLLSGLHGMAKSMAVVSDAATFTVEAVDAGYALALGHVGNKRPVPHQRTEYGLLTVLMLCNWLTRQDLKPLAAEFAFPLPVSLDPYRDAFQCAISFNQNATRLLLKADDLTAALPSHNPSMLAVHEQLIAHRLHDLGAQSIAAQVRRHLMARLQYGEPRREEIARLLCMTDRTLQRRLQAEQASFQNLLDEVRAELAQKYLADNHYVLAQVSDLLGFVDQSNFFRACKRWFGVPPGLYRSQMLEGSGALARKH